MTNECVKAYLDEEFSKLFCHACKKVVALTPLSITAISRNTSQWEKEGHSKRKEDLPKCQEYFSTRSMSLEKSTGLPSQAQLISGKLITLF